MRNFDILVLLLAVSFPAFASATADHDDWYRHQYGPLWSVDTGSKIDEIAGFYADQVLVHPTEGDSYSVASRDWLAEGISEWTADGWVGSEIVAYRSDRLNESTATFKAKWHDRYADGSEAFECGWYLARLGDDGWRFTQYAAIDCEAHGL